MLPVRSMPDSLRNPRPSQDDAFDQVDVPAAVVCAVCGDAECGGCANELSRSGVVTIIAWERPGGRVLGKLWQTARATTRDAEAFFELLPDGPVGPALTFALTCELVAATGTVLSLLMLIAIAAPGWLKHVVLDPASREFAIRLIVGGIPSLAVMLVLAHAAHGLSLDRGARKSGARKDARARALRFGLYASGWDLVIGPVGAIVVAAKEGIRAALGLFSMTVGLPTRSARAFLRGCYQLQGRDADRAVSTSYVAAAVVTLLGAVVIIASAIAVVLAIG